MAGELIEHRLGRHERHLRAPGPGEDDRIVDRTFVFTARAKRSTTLAPSLKKYGAWLSGASVRRLVVSTTRVSFSPGPTESPVHHFTWVGGCAATIRITHGSLLFSDRVAIWSRAPRYAATPGLLLNGV